MNNRHRYLSSILICGAAMWGSQIHAQTKVIVPPEPVDVLPSPTVTPGFGIPEGLKTPANDLLLCLGFGPAACFPLTPDSCFDVGYKCVCARHYEDALAFANHGLKMCNHARLYLLKAICELELGRCDDATNTLGRYRLAAARPEENVGLYAARERLNGPARVRLEILLKAWREMP
jgi:hypothetical protein